ncbi:conserved hypothetical protein, partial [Ixodes scapularis]
PPARTGPRSPPERDQWAEPFSPAAATRGPRGRLPETRHLLRNSPPPLPARPLSLYPNPLPSRPPPSPARALPQEEVSPSPK